MSDFYATMRKTAAGLLRSYGCRVTLRRLLPGTYNPASGRRSEDTLLEWKALAIRSAVSGEYLGGSSGGSRVRGGEMQLLLDCGACCPQLGDRVLFPDGGHWVIIREQPLEPAGKPVFYRAIIRRE